MGAGGVRRGECVLAAKGQGLFVVQTCGERKRGPQDGDWSRMSCFDARLVLRQGLIGWLVTGGGAWWEQGHGAQVAATEVNADQPSWPAKYLQ